MRRYKFNMYRAYFYKMYKILARWNKKTHRPVRLTRAQRAFKRCDRSRGGIISKSEWRSCRYRLGLKRCTLRRYSRYISRVLRNGNKYRFGRMFNFLMRVNRRRCRRATPTKFWARTWKMCDFSKGGRISPSEIRRCGPKIWKRCTLRRAKAFIVRTFKKFNPRGTNGLNKRAWRSFVKVMNRVNRLRCSK
jgi:hypothetical protein